MSKSLIHVGYPKAGSTFLQAWFGKHPQLKYAHGGLMGFYNVYQIAQQAANTSDSSCAYYVTSYEGLSMPSGDAGDYPLGYGNPQPTAPDLERGQATVCRMLKDLFPGSRVLIVTRGFKGLFRSGYSQFVRAGGPGHPRELVRFYAKGTAEYIQAVDIDRLIAMYANAFGRDNLIILPYELLRDDQQRFIATLEERLGLAHYELEIGRLNPSLSPAELYWYPIISRYVSALARRLGKRGYARTYRWYVSKTMENKLWWLVRILNRIKPNTITEADYAVMDESLPALRGKASLLRDDSLYAPYAAEYLWD